MFLKIIKGRKIQFLKTNVAVILASMSLALSVFNITLRICHKKDFVVVDTQMITKILSAKLVKNGPVSEVKMQAAVDALKGKIHEYAADKSQIIIAKGAYLGGGNISDMTDDVIDYLFEKNHG